jgi:hypothetical protein
MLVPDADVEACLETLADETGAACRASHEYLDDLTKTVLAELMGQANETSAVAKETWARAQPKFREHLAKVGEMAKRDYIWRQRYSAANAKIECWRTQQANVRAAERVR